MLIRHRWYRIDLPPNYDLARTLSKMPLLESSRYGFYRVGGGDSERGFRFVWRTTIVATRYNALGEPEHEEYKSVCAMNLSLLYFGKKIFMRLDNPNRNVRGLMNALESASGFGFTCTPVTFESALPRLFLEQVDESRLLSIKVVASVAGEDLVSRMEFASKQGINLNRVRSLSGMTYRVESSVYHCVFRGVSGQIGITANGTVRLAGALTPRLLYYIQRELPLLSKSGEIAAS